jgi:hypothetical protein
MEPDIGAAISTPDLRDTEKGAPSFEALRRIDGSNMDEVLL